MTISLIEILVLVCGLGLGYWVVSKVTENFDRDEKHPLGDRATTQPQAGADAPAPWHEVLSVPPDASADEIRQAYQLLMQQYHPDKVATLAPELKALAERRSKEINGAFERAMQDR